MSASSFGKLIPLAKIKNQWVNCTNFPDIIELLLNISYKEKGVLKDDRIDFNGRWSIASTFRMYFPYDERYIELQELMKKHNIDELELTFCDIHEDKKYYQFGIVQIYPDKPKALIFCNHGDYEDDYFEKSSEWKEAENVFFTLDDDDDEFDNWLEIIEQFREIHYKEVEAYFFKIIPTLEEKNEELKLKSNLKK